MSSILRDTEGMAIANNYPNKSMDRFQVKLDAFARDCGLKGIDRNETLKILDLG